MRRTKSGFRLAQSPVIKKVEWIECFARISRMRAVGSDGPPASKVRAIRGLLVVPRAISAADTGCKPGGLSQDDSVGWSVGVVPCVGNGVGITVLTGDGVEIAVAPEAGVCVAVVPDVAVG